MKKRLIVLILTAVMAFGCVSVASASLINEDNVAKGFSGEVFVNSSGTDFFILDEAMYHKIYDIIPGEGTGIYTLESFTPLSQNGNFYYIKDRYFPGVKTVIMQAAASIYAK